MRDRDQEQILEIVTLVYGGILNVFGYNVPVIVKSGFLERIQPMLELQAVVSSGDWRAS